ncbi:NifU family protein [Sulfurospirillum arcachonense]|uniref:NifU family protein n=1 Tax=Sulfurospirillum arcachonense TaxID=57666 RepID=UPI000469AFB2|nr:NifU family protein [Sulfurospirillum arcachonense]
MNHAEALKAYKAKDYESAFSLWSKEAELKSDQAMANLGLMYLKGEGVDKDYAKAKEWFEKASEFENDSANYNLALMYQSKIGVDEDINKAIEYFRRAVKKNHQGANFRLGLLLLKDRTNEVLVKEGFNCMLNAAKSGHAMARIQMGGVDRPKKESPNINLEFKKMSLEKKKEVVTDALDRYIRPILVQDGGNIMLIDFLSGVDTEIRLAYQGNCAGCSMASTSTYELIENTLTKVIDENIKVYII